MKILIVDDKEENLFALEQLLDDMGGINFETVTANSGNNAVSMAYTQDFDLILMDIKMPDMDGFEAAKLMRKDGKNKGTMIVFLSAVYKDDAAKVEGLKSGAFDLIEKPIDEEKFTAKIKLYVKLTKYEKENSS